MSALARRLWDSPTVTTWGSLLVRLATMVVVLPLVLVRFAPADVALWQLFSTLFLLALMLDFGLAPTFARMLSFARGGATLADMRGMAQPATQLSRPADPAVLAALVSSLRWLYPRMAIGAVLLLALLGTAALMRPVAQTADPQAAWLAWGVVLASTGVGLWGGVYSAALQGMDKIALMRRWEVATGLAQIGSSAAVLALGGGLLALIVASQAWVVVGALRNRWLLARSHPAVFAVAPARQPDVLRLLWSPAWRSGLGVLMSHGLIQASGLVYSQLAPAAEVAAYLLALRLILVISQFCQAPFYSKLPRLAELHAAGCHNEQLRLAQRGMRLAYWVFVVGALVVAVGVPPLLQAIGSRIEFVSPGVWALLALAFFAERIGAMHLQLYSLTNHIVWHIANGLTGLSVLALAIGLYGRFNVLAFPLAMLVSYSLFYCTYSLYLSSRAFSIHLRRFEARTSMGPAACLFAGLFMAVYFFPPRNALLP